MKRSLQLIIIISLFFSACKPKHAGKNKAALLSESGDITVNEDRGIKEIIAFYGGQCEYGVSITNNETDFWLKFSHSPSIDSLPNLADLSCANIAYLFYKNLNGEENSYNHIQSELILGNGEDIKQSYTIHQLEKVKAKIGVVNKIVDLIREKNFKGIRDHLIIDTSLYKFDEASLVPNLQKAEIQFGKPKQFVPYGFAFFSSSRGKELLYLSGMIKRETGMSSFFNVNLDPNSTDDKIYTLNYMR